MRVLIVEDEPKMADLLRRGLSEQGAVVDVAERGEDALWIAGATSFDAIVLDVICRESTASRPAGACARPASGRRCSC